MSQGERDQPDLQVGQAGSEIAGDDPAAVALAGSAPSVTAGVRSDLEAAWVAGMAEDPGRLPTVGEASGASAVREGGPELSVDAIPCPSPVRVSERYVIWTVFRATCFVGIK